MCHVNLFLHHLYLYYHNNMITTHKNDLLVKCRERLYKVEEVMDCVVHQNGDIWTIDIDHPKYPRTIKNGVGTELKKLLSIIGIKSTPNCKCTTRAIEMNFNGIKWCKNNYQTILAWLKEESIVRKLPFIESIALHFINIAIKKAEKIEKKNDSI